ncbi:MAG TPA: class I SAM-dependent methyltransferase, partial [Gammaproteobacteria bacterium]|nr:class I SAM-dependent methyltransferase [Gammaproteobacteria bacterium]
EPWLRVPCDYRDPQRRGGAYEVYWCAESRFGQVMPRPSAAEVAESYEVTGYYTHENGAPAPARLSLANRVLQHLAWRADAGAHIDAAALKPFVDRGGSRICDIGCGAGTLLEAAIAAGFTTAVGIESDPSARAAAARKGLAVYAGTAEQLPLEAQARRFDLVLMSHVLEHTLSPVQALRNAAGLLEPGGSMMIEVPNNEACGLDFAGNCWCWLDVPRHLNFFTTTSLRSICRLVGLEPRNMEYAGYSRQFSVEWQANQAYIHSIFASVPGGGGAAKPSPLSYWHLLARTVFATPERKYDSVRAWAQKVHDQ